MAKIQSQSVVITLNKLVKDSDPDFDQSLASEEMVAAVEQIAQELVGEGIVVEVQVVV
jgi:hypothetical protein